MTQTRVSGGGSCVGQPRGMPVELDAVMHTNRPLDDDDDEAPP
jgi:hypothetical protein